jgi:glycopeptide antibiotics resistance protein
VLNYLVCSKGPGLAVFPDRRTMRWVHSVWVFSSLFLILAVTLYPYSFSFHAVSGELIDYSFFLGWGRSDDLDVFVNTLLFLPWGFSLANTLAGTKQCVGLGAFATVFALSAGLSYAVEILQVFLTHRFPSLVDVIANSSGGIAGFLCFRLRRIQNVRLNLSVYVVAAFLASILLQRGTGLGNWDTTFPLLLGNEKTGDRPWKGYISHLYIADRAISEAEVKQAARQNNALAPLADSLLASYRFTTCTERFHDEAGLLPDLLWKERLPTIQSHCGAFLSPNHWLETGGYVPYLVNKIRKSSQFTLGITAATFDTIQTGPARIVSLSINPYWRNFTLGQEQSDLVFRLRTPATAFSNGDKSALRAPGVFANKNLQSLILTYNGSELILYVNEIPSPMKLELGPGSALCSLFLDSPLIGSKFCKLFYYATIFIPLGVLVALITGAMVGHIVKKLLVIIGGSVFASVSLEGLLIAVSGKSWNMENLFISMVMTLGTVVVWVWSQTLRKNYVTIRFGSRLRSSPEMNSD